jgi:hypothetical protein
MANKYLNAFNLSSSDLEQLKYPVLVWSDLDDDSKIILLTDQNTERTVYKQEGHSIIEMLNKIDENVEKFANEASQGDETQYVFKLVEFENDSINWDSTINEYQKKISALPYKEGDFEISIVTELNNHYIQDVKAGLMECIYNSIVANMHTIATDLNIESMGFLGELTYLERFRQIIHKNLNSDFNVILGN